jgi:uncharacterized delta-60 repeat protein
MVASSPSYRTRRSAVVAGAFAILFFAFTGSIAQVVPCEDPRSQTTKFIKPAKNSLARDCRRQLRRTPAKTEGEQPDVSISGHITHQNGVRMGGITMTLHNQDSNTTRTVVSDEQGNYFFGAIPWGSAVELTPSRTGYEFFPPAVIWAGIVEDEIMNFIAVGPPPPPPPPPANQPTLAWSTYFDNTPQLADYNALIGRDGAGNIYVAGTSFTENDNAGDTDVVVFKIDTNGNRVWSRTYDGPGSYKDAARDMFVDAAGNIYIAGFTYFVDSGNPALNSYDYLLLKYNAGGDLVWSKQYGGNPGYDDFARSIKVDASGNVYVGGYSWGVGTYANYATVKYNSTGDQMWAKRFAGGNGEILNEVEVDTAGNVYVTGYSNRTAAGGSEDIVTIKYDAAGEQQWLNRYNSAADDSDEGYALEITPSGDVLVLGESYDFGNSTMLVHKIAGATGVAVFTRDLSSIDPDRSEFPESIKLDADGNIILSGMLYDDVSYNVDSFVAKLNSEATVTWAKTYDGPADEDYDGDPKIALFGGAIYLAVTSEGFANADIQVIKYLADGSVDWTYRYGNPYFSDDYVSEYSVDNGQRSMLLDPQGNVYVAGESFIPNQSTDLVAFKLEPVAQTRAVAGDFDGDRKADVAVYRPDTGVWWVLNSSDGTYSATRWGLPTDTIVPADYDGDGRIDRAIYRDGLWYVLRSSTGGYTVEHFGLASDKPVPSDFDNDGKADLSVFRQGVWHLLRSSDRSYSASQFGLESDRPMPADYDSNRSNDVAVYRSGVWYVRYQNELPMAAFQFGITTDKPVPADYDGDRRADYAVFRQGVWYIWESRTTSPTIVQWGLASDIPVPADYDGDKKTDLAVYRDGVWYIRRSTDGGATILQFGLASDIPVPAAFTR